jgi:hypothetical protein
VEVDPSESQLVDGARGTTDHLRGQVGCQWSLELLKQRQGRLWMEEEELRAPEIGGQLGLVSFEEDISVV